MLPKFSRWLVSLLIVGGLILGGCTPQEGSSQSSENSATTTPVSVTQANNPQMNNLPRLEGKATVVMVVNGSPITIELDGTNAPVTAGNFVDLIQRGVYDNSVFHRVEKNFVVQGGDPQSKDQNFRGQLGTGGFVDPDTKQARNIPLEIKPQGADSPVYSKTFESARISQAPVLDHKRGAVAMARSMSPDSASSQFYFALSDINFLDGNYAVFGYVTQGMDVIDKIAIGDRIESAKITQGAENLKK
jgi:peptidyl-prolyl cis-trans isomerase B (cyclophilin B)